MLLQELRGLMGRLLGRVDLIVRFFFPFFLLLEADVVGRDVNKAVIPYWRPSASRSVL